MSINDVMNYVSQTPGNTNPSVIRSMFSHSALWRDIMNSINDTVYLEASEPVSVYE